jgi:mono/diheme cytochrome c family protein
MLWDRIERGSVLALVATLALAPWLVAHGEQLSFAEIERGRYLAAAGDCEACHTSKDGTPFAGGRPIETPFGTIFSANITPDRDTGIGAWSDDQFYRALHEGIAADGSNLYPAFPYPWYTKVTRDDSDAIRAFLKTLPPVPNKKPDNQLVWPLGNRAVMAGWNELFFKPGTFSPDATKSADWNRGAYLVEGLGHCGACHTPTNVFGAAEKGNHLQGGTLQNWYAPSLSGDLRSGLGAWSVAEIVEFLKTGRNARTAAYGPMSEVITFTTSKLSGADLTAMATYLKDMPAGKPQTQPEKLDPSEARAGEAIFVDNCSACHRTNGEGVAGMFPSLKGDAVVQSAKATTAIRLILNGGRSVATDARPTSLSMPSFGWKLSDEQVAAVASYMRGAWGNAAPPVSASDVSALRSQVGLGEAAR